MIIKNNITNNIVIHNYKLDMFYKSCVNWLDSRRRRESGAF